MGGFIFLSTGEPSRGLGDPDEGKMNGFWAPIPSSCLAKCWLRKKGVEGSDWGAALQVGRSRGLEWGKADLPVLGGKDLSMKRH